MSQENVEIVRSASRMFNERDFSQVPELLDPAVVIDLSRNVFDSNVYTGYDGVRRFVADVDEMWDGVKSEIEEVIDAGDTLVTETRMSGVWRDSGVRLDMQVFQVVTLRNGRVRQVTGGYRSRGEALHAAGLTE